MTIRSSCLCHPQDKAKGGLFTRFTQSAVEIPPPERALRDAGSAILKSDALSQLWNIEHPSLTDKNPLPLIAQTLLDPAHNFENSPELIAFMRELIAIEIRALGRTRKDEPPEDQEFRQYLNSMLAYADTLEPKLKRDDLPDEFRQTLYILADKAGQIPVRPLKATWTMMKSYGKHLYEHAGEQKALFGCGLAAGAGLLAFMNMKIGLGKSSFVDVAAPTDLDSLLNADTPLQGGASSDTAAISRDAMITLCDDHINYLGQFGQFIKDILQSDLLLPHCAKPKTLAIDAQNSLNGFYDLTRVYLDTTVTGPVMDFGRTILPDAKFQQAFLTAAHNAAQTVYQIDWVENWALHIGITSAAIASTLDLSSRGKDELRGMRDSISDFFSRTWDKTPLNYYLSASASTLAYAMNDYDIKTPSIFWAGILGGISGQLIHNAINHARAPHFAQDTMIGVKKEAAIFSNALNIVSDNRGENTYIPRPYTWKSHLKPLALAGTATLAAGDLMMNEGQITGAVTGTAFVGGTYVFVNIPQDMALHTIFIALGIGIAGAIKGGQKMLHLVSGYNKDNEPT